MLIQCRDTPIKTDIPGDAWDVDPGTPLGTDDPTPIRHIALVAVKCTH